MPTTRAPGSRSGDMRRNPSELKERVYRTLYKTLGNAIGFQVARNILKIDEESFEKEPPKDALVDMARHLKESFGEEAVYNMIYITIISEFNERESMEILKLLDLPNAAEMKR